LSAFLDVADVPGRRPTKVQVIDIDRVRSPLAVISDGKHVSIVPVLSGGDIDRNALEGWAAAREAENIHEFNQLVLDAVVAQRVLE
jgi:hypothetical protein